MDPGDRDAFHARFGRVAELREWRGDVPWLADRGSRDLFSMEFFRHARPDLDRAREMLAFHDFLYSKGRDDVQRLSGVVSFTVCRSALDDRIGLLVVSLNMPGSVPDAADLVV